MIRCRGRMRIMMTATCINGYAYRCSLMHADPKQVLRRSLKKKSIVSS
ncbi:hypothetical protein AAJ76_1080007603 [Vairimorpha ceranae]|uniref:Uncharacterized protein n=1 Tax=Vairimorpha ceranae TaxID=40302 RepID=A0A0F9Z8F0_9MICR|nr:hypothetical protein AAJ76_1080007603 [Vairimorpha ceranae]KKO74164.1 hypothetical protein AAJ76_1080007603 [Vairimorpha ceranae]